MTDKEFFLSHGFIYERGEMFKIYIESAMRAVVDIDWEGLKITYTVGVMRGGALFDGRVSTCTTDREEAIKLIDNFANRMKI